MDKKRYPSNEFDQFYLDFNEKNFYDPKKIEMKSHDLLKDYYNVTLFDENDPRKPFSEILLKGNFEVSRPLSKQ